MGNERSKIPLEFKTPLLSGKELKPLSNIEKIHDFPSTSTIIQKKSLLDPVSKTIIPEVMDKEKTQRIDEMLMVSRWEAERKRQANIESELKKIESDNESALSVMFSVPMTSLILSTMTNVLYYNFVSGNGKLSIIFSRDNKVWHILEISVTTAVSGLSMQIRSDNVKNLFEKLSYRIKMHPEKHVKFSLRNSQLIFAFEENLTLHYVPVRLEESTDNKTDEKINDYTNVMKLLKEEEVSKNDWGYICHSSAINPTLSDSTSMFCVCCLVDKDKPSSSLWVQNTPTVVGFSVVNHLDGSEKNKFSISISRQQYNDNLAILETFQHIDSKLTARLTVCGKNQDYLKIQYRGHNNTSMVALTSFYPNRKLLE